MPFRLFAAKRRLAKRQKDAMRKDDKIKVSNGVFSQVFFFFFFRLFVLNFCLFAWRVLSFRFLSWRYSVFLSFRMAFFRVFVFVFCFFFVDFFFCVCVFFRMASFCLFAWRLFAAKRQKDEMAQTSHHI